jgi:hypothetical protein
MLGAQGRLSRMPPEVLTAIHGGFYPILPGNLILKFSQRPQQPSRDPPVCAAVGLESPRGVCR